MKRILLSIVACAAGLMGTSGAALAATAADQPTVLITGSNKGIGYALAETYAKRGWNVIATARNPGEADELQTLAKAHPAVKLEALDVTDFAQIDALAAKYQGKPIDVLINNAGITVPMSQQMFGKLDYESFRNVLEVNTIGPMKVTEAFYPSVLASKQKKIITISTSEGSFGKLNAGRLYWYRSSKAAVNMLMLNLAHNVKGKGVAIGLINPGPVDTDLMKGVKMKLQTPAESAAKIVPIIDKIDVASTGKFWDYDGGELPW